MFLLSFLVPENALDCVKEAIFKTGAGSVGNYSKCAWQTLGEGQFLPLKGSKPAIGEIEKLTKVAEYKVDIVCTKEQIKNAVAALAEAHPYETIAYQVFKIELDY